MSEDAVRDLQNELEDIKKNIDTFIEELIYHQNNGHHTISSEWVINELRKLK